MVEPFHVLLLLLVVFGLITTSLLSFLSYQLDVPSQDDGPEQPQEEVRWLRSRICIQGSLEDDRWFGSHVLCDGACGVGRRPTGRKRMVMRKRRGRMERNRGIGIRGREMMGR